MAVAADIKNTPRADSMNPINWIIEAAILDLAQTKLVNRCRRAVKMAECERAATYHRVCFNKEQLLSDVYLKIFMSLCPSFGETVGGGEFPPVSNKRVWCDLALLFLHHSIGTEPK